MNLPTPSTRSLALTVMLGVVLGLAVPVTESTPVRAAAAGCGPTSVVNHAAGKLHAPENTVAGIHEAAASGADIVEMDVRWSKGDGTAAYPGWPLLMHNTTTLATTGVNMVVANSGITTLTALSAANYAPWSTDPTYAGTNPDGKPKTPVPYGWDFFNAAHRAGVTPLLDVQVIPTRVQMDLLVRYADAFPGMRDKMIYMGSYENVKTVRAWYPELRYGVLEYPPNDGSKALRVFTPEHLKAVGAFFYGVPFQYLRPGLVGYMHAEGVQVYTWTSDNTNIDHIGNWQQAYQWGVDGLITNESAAALAACLPGL